MNHIDKLHLTKLDGEMSKLFNEASLEIREGFNNFISQLSEGHEDDIDWWVSNLASRNTLSSILFVDFCYLAFVKKIVDGLQTIGEIVTPSRRLALTLRKFFAENKISTKVNCGASFTERVKNIVRPFCHFAYSCYHFHFRYWHARKSGKSVKALPREPITLLDTFVFEDSFKENSYLDRYYTGIFDYLSDEERENIYYLPSLFKIRNYSNIFTEMRSAKQNFLIKEDFLKIRDYMFALAYPFRRMTFKPNINRFIGFDVTSLVKDELYQWAASADSVEALLKYLLAKRLREAGIQIRLVVEWFENQAIDKGSIAGFRKYYADTPVIGYQGFIVSRNYLCAFPTVQEEKGKVLPHQVAVVGSGLAERVKEFCPALDVIVAPAFRFRGISDKNEHFNNGRYFSVLVGLPIIMKDSEEILELIALTLDDIKKEGLMLKFVIKPHPTNDKRRIAKYLKEWPLLFEIVDGDFNSHIDKAGLLISNGSSICIETLSKGVPVIVIGSRSGLTHNPVPDSIKDDIWCLCYTVEELRKAIVFYASRNGETVKRHREIGKKIRRDFFEPVTRESVRSFLRI